MTTREASFWENGMYKVLLLLALASSISTAATSTGIVLGALLMIGQRIRTRQWPAMDRGIARAVLVFCLLQCVIAGMSLAPRESFSEVWGTSYRLLPLFFAMMYLRSVQQLRGLFIAVMASIFIDNVVALRQFFLGALPTGFNVTHIFYGDHLLMAIPVLLLVMHKPYMQIWAKRFAVLTLIFTLGMTALSYARGTWIALAAMLLVWLLLDRRWRRQVLCITAVIALGFGLLMAVSPGFQNRVESITDPQHSANTERILMWHSAMEITRDYPVFGVGQDQFARVYNTEYISPLARERTQDGNPLHGLGHPHNNVLKTASEGGILGLLAFFTLFGYLLYRLYKGYKAEQNGSGLSPALMGILIWVGLQAAGLTDTNITQVPIMREFWLLMGTLLAADFCERKS